jgi:hypothetical protein
MNSYHSNILDQKERKSNVLDPVQPTVDPRLFDNPEDEQPTLKPAVAHWIITTVHSALEKAGYEDLDKWLSLVFTGSLTTFQYSDLSDVDISLFVDHKKFPDWSRAEMIGVMVENVDGTQVPGTPYPLQCFVVPPEVKREDLYQPGLRSGYDLQSNSWIVPPERGRVHDVKKEMYAAYAYALESADKMEHLLKYEPDKAIMYWHQVHRRRRRDQQAGKGDYAPSNIVYKELANRGLFPALSEISGEYIAKVAAETTKKRLERAQALDNQYGPDSSEVVHQWPDGWTMRKLKTRGDMQREGELVGNCFAHDPGDDFQHREWAESPWSYFFQYQDDPNNPGGDTIKVPEGHEKFDPTYGLDGTAVKEHPDMYRDYVESDLYSLRDPNNLPHVSFDPNAHEFEEAALGRHNTPMKPEYAQRFIEWSHHPTFPNTGDDPEEWRNTWKNIAQGLPPRASALLKYKIIPEALENAQAELGIVLPVRFLPTLEDRRGGYSGISRDPITGRQSHLIYLSPNQGHGAANWALWHELAHAADTERTGTFEDTSGMTSEEYGASDREKFAEEIANRHADIELIVPIGGGNDNANPQVQQEKDP